MKSLKELLKLADENIYRVYFTFVINMLLSYVIVQCLGHIKVNFKIRTKDQLLFSAFGIISHLEICLFKTITNICRF